MSDNDAEIDCELFEQMYERGLRKKQAMEAEIERLQGDRDELLAALKEAFQYAPFHTADCEGIAEYREDSIFDEMKGCTCFLSRIRAIIDKVEKR